MRGAWSADRLWVAEPGILPKAHVSRGFGDNRQREPALHSLRPPVLNRAARRREMGAAGALLREYRSAGPNRFFWLFPRGDRESEGCATHIGSPHQCSRHSRIAVTASTWPGSWGSESKKLKPSQCRARRRSARSKAILRDGTKSTDRYNAPYTHARPPPIAVPRTNRMRRPASQHRSIQIQLHPLSRPSSQEK